jgi:hypothetical protein
MALHRAALGSDVDSMRQLIEAKADVNEVDGNGQTPLMLASCKGDMEACWLLLDAQAVVSVRDKGGSTALDMARGRGFVDIVELMGGEVERAQGAPTVPDFSSEEEEVSAMEELGPSVVLDHTVKLGSMAVSDFPWQAYEAGLARLAGVPEANGRVFVTPEPGSGSLIAHATIIKRVTSWEVTGSSGVDEVMKTVKSLRNRERLQQAGGGAPLLAASEVNLLNAADGDAAAEQLAERLRSLTRVRAEYEALRRAHAEGLDADAKGLAAGQAILLLRPLRKAIEVATAPMGKANSSSKAKAVGATAVRAGGPRPSGGSSGACAGRGLQKGAGTSASRVGGMVGGRGRG